jgi:rhomboid family GlyGly-CTERM serine protease
VSSSYGYEIRLSAVLLAAVAVYLLPFSPALVYDRGAILEKAEYWRLITGHWVHFSAMHLVGNLAVIGSVGWLNGRYRGGPFDLLSVLWAAGIGVGLLLWAPLLERFAGLSGVGHAACTHLAVCTATGRGWRRIAGIGFLALLLVKVVWDFRLDPSSQLFSNVPLEPRSHALGFALGLISGLTVAWIGGRRARA